MSISQFCDWLGATPLSLFLQTVDWIIPLVQSIHILGVAMVLGSVLFVNLRVVRVLARDDQLTTVTRRYLPVMWGALAVLLMTGLTLTLAEPRRELLNWTFWTKMSLLVIVVLITLTIQRPLRRDQLYWESGRRKVTVKVLACVSLAIWVGIVFCGRWIAYNGATT